MNRKRALITGAGGFVGSHLCQACLSAGYEVRAFVRYNSQASAGWIDHLPEAPNIEITAGDIRDIESVRSAVRGCGTVFHLAALIGIPFSFASPAAYVRTNVEGCSNVLEAAREFGTENVLLISTSEVYGTARYVPMDEEHPLSARSPYAASKIAAEQLGLSYHRSFGLPVKVIRPFNVYGPRQSVRAVIPSIIVQLLRGETEIALGSMHPRRDLTFVRDAVRAFLAVAEVDGLSGDVVNVGSDCEYSVAELLRTCSALVGRDARPVFDERRARPALSEVDRLHCDNKKIRTLTAWTPDFDLQTGLSETLNWWKDHLSDTRGKSFAW
jgi:NAD dependent epimerase/dehydratase